jgi:hypothetical protein
MALGDQLSCGAESAGTADCAETGRVTIWWAPWFAPSEGGESALWASAIAVPVLEFPRDLTTVHLAGCVAATRGRAASMPAASMESDAAAGEGVGRLARKSE